MTSLHWQPATSLISKGCSAGLRDRGSGGSRRCRIPGQSPYDWPVARSSNLAPQRRGTIGVMWLEFDEEHDVATIHLAATDAGVVEDACMEHPSIRNGDLSLALDGDGRILSIEVIGARALLPASVLRLAQQREG